MILKDTIAFSHGAASGAIAPELLPTPENLDGSFEEMAAKCLISMITGLITMAINRWFVKRKKR